MLIDLSCPVENRGTIIKTNSETGEPYLLLKLFNLSEKKITSVNFTVSAFNSTGAELGKIPVELTELSAEPKAFFAENKAISLVDMEEAKHFVVDVKSVVFDDETSYEPSQKYTVYTEDKDAPVDDVIALREFVPEAVCYSKEHTSYWRCVCGRPNFPDSDNCVRCEREKSDVLEKFSSRESLDKLICDNIIAEEKALAEEAERIALEKEAKKKKLIKTLIISAIALGAAVVLALIGFFTYRGILTINGNNALKNKDYYKAHEFYSKANSKKAFELTKYVQGNTPENLMFQSGLISSDSENLYYLVLDDQTYTFSLIKENKKTKEKISLTDAAGGSLNVTNDWIYFVDTENGGVKRITKDGETIENVIDTPVTYLSVIGDTIYFAKAEYDNPNGLSEEQCQILAAQGQIKTFNYLYKTSIDDALNKKTNKAKRLLDDSASSTYIYNDRIYYLTDGENQWESYNLCSVNLNGKDKKVIVDVPVASFVVKDDIIYFVKMYKDEYKGKEIQDATALDYSLYSLNLQDNKTDVLTDKYLITYTNTNDEKLFFIGYDRDEYFAAQQNTDGTSLSPSSSLYSYNYKTKAVSTMVSGDVQVFNVYDEDLVMFLSTVGMCRVKSDATGFEALSVKTQAPSEEAPTEETPAENNTDAE